MIRGEGLRIKNSEKEQWDRTFTVQIQKNVWCGEKVMATWMQNDWGSYVTNPPTRGSDGKLLITDIQRRQQIPRVNIT